VSIDPTKDTAELLLQALAVGDLHPQDSRVLARFAAEPELATRWQQLAATLAVLSDLGGGPEPTSGPALEVRPLDTMAAIRTFRRESSREPGSWRLLIPAAALVAAALVLVWWLLPPAAPPTDPQLGGTGMVLAPNGVKWAAGSPLRWTHAPGAESYRLQLQPPDGPAVTIPDGPFRLTGTEWLPSADQGLQLPRRFRWQVIAFDGDNRQRATSGWAETWR